MWVANFGCKSDQRYQKQLDVAIGTQVQTSNYTSVNTEPPPPQPGFIVHHEQK